MILNYPSYVELKTWMFMLVCLNISCQAQPKNSATLVKTETTYRLTPTGDKDLENYKEYDLSGNLIFIRDYMNGAVYLLHWYKYDTANCIKFKLSASCQSCPQDTTFYFYQNEKLIKTYSKRYTNYFEYDKFENQIKEIELITDGAYIRRIKIMKYSENKMLSKTSYDFSKEKIYPDGTDLDSLLLNATPYHQFSNTYDNNSKVIESHWKGSVTDWFAIHKHIYDENGRPTKVNYFSEKGVSGGSRIYEYTFHEDIRNPETPLQDSLDAWATISATQLTRQGKTNQKPFDQYLLNGEPYNGWSHELFETSDHRYRYAQYNNGIITWQITYFLNGRISSDFRMSATNGKGIGIERMWHSNGYPYINNAYSTPGVLDGWQFRWHPNGQLAKKALWTKGNLVYELIYDINGILIEQKSENENKP